MGYCSNEVVPILISDSSCRLAFCLVRRFQRPLITYSRTCSRQQEQLRPQTNLHRRGSSFATPFAVERSLSEQVHQAAHESLFWFFGFLFVFFFFFVFFFGFFFPVLASMPRIAIAHCCKQEREHWEQEHRMADTAACTPAATAGMPGLRWLHRRRRGRLHLHRVSRRRRCSANQKQEYAMRNQKEHAPLNSRFGRRRLHHHDVSCHGSLSREPELAQARTHMMRIMSKMTAPTTMAGT